MYRVEERTLSLKFRSLQGCSKEMFRAERPINYSPAVMQDDKTGMTVMSGSLAQQSVMNCLILMPRFENHHISYEKEMQETKAVTGEKIMLNRHVRNHTDCLTALTMASKRQGSVAAGLSSKVVQALTSTMPKEEGILDTSVPAAHVELSKNSRITFSTICDAMKGVCNAYDTDFWQLNEFYDMDKGDS